MFESYAKNLGPQKGVAHDDANVQIGYVTQCSGQMFKISLYFGNKQKTPITGLGLQLAEAMSPSLKIKSRPEVLSNLNIQPEEQLAVEFLVEVGSFSYDPPKMEFVYNIGSQTSEKLPLELPLPKLSIIGNVAIAADEMQFLFPQKDRNSTAAVTTSCGNKSLVFIDMEGMGYDCKLMLKGEDPVLKKVLNPEPEARNSVSDLFNFSL